VTHEHRTEAETRIRAAMHQLLAGPVPDGLKCDIKSLCTLAGVPRATLYRTYPHLKAEFGRQRITAQETGRQPDPRLAQIERLKAEVATLHERLNRKNTELDALKEFQATALSRLAAQHDEITRMRQQFASHTDAAIRHLPTRRIPMR
jgi:predicted nuclease with TOPRIM domain